MYGFPAFLSMPLSISVPYKLNISITYQQNQTFFAKQRNIVFQSAFSANSARSDSQRRRAQREEKGNLFNQYCRAGKKMEVITRAFIGLAGIIALLLAASFPAAVAAVPPVSAPAAMSDGTTIDQGIAYVLMLVALVLTYIIH